MKIKKFPKYAKLLIVWQDILSDSSWHELKDIDKIQAIPVKTLGFFLQNKRKDLKIAHSITNDGESDYTIIPWSVITSIEEI